MERSVRVRYYNRSTLRVLCNVARIKRPDENPDELEQRLRLALGITDEATARLDTEPTPC
jgi:hypothetical protein